MIIKNLFKSKSFSKYTEIYKQDGFKGLLRVGGWKLCILVFLFFLIKGLLWLLIPYLLAKGFF